MSGFISMKYWYNNQEINQNNDADGNTGKLLQNDVSEEALFYEQKHLHIRKAESHECIRDRFDCR